jgi:hypothetical protein
LESIQVFEPQLRVLSELLVASGQRHVLELEQRMLPDANDLIADRHEGQIDRFAKQHVDALPPTTSRRETRLIPPA